MAPQPASLNRPAPTPQPAARAPLSLASVRRGRSENPVRTLLYGVEGIGKTTFAASAPRPIFAGPEDGAGLLDIERFEPADWGRLREFIALLTRDPHDYQTLVLDTLDWIEPLLWASICERDGKKDVEDYGYGKGYVAAVDEWRVFIADLERLRAARRMQIIMLAHSWIKPFKNPEGEDFDRYELKIHAKAGGLLKEWSDVVLFANYETFAQKDSKTKRVRGVSTGARLCYTTRTAAYDAKNRFGLPETFALDWPEYEAALRAHQPAQTDALIGEIKRKAAEVGGTVEQQALDMVAKHASDPDMLVKINNRLNAKLAEKEN